MGEGEEEEGRGGGGVEGGRGGGREGWRGELGSYISPCTVDVSV